MHGPTFGLAGSHRAFVAPGSIRQMREAPVGNGKPFSSETYQAPSGPMATAVGTDSTGTGVPGGGPGKGSPSGHGHGASSGLNRATVLILRRVSTFNRSLPAASATRTPPPGRRARPFGLDSSGMPSWSSGSGSPSWYAAMSTSAV